MSTNSAKPRRVKRKRDNVVALAPPPRDGECETLSLKLLGEVSRDQVAGIVLITIFKRGVGPKRYHLRTAGLANDDSTLALGAMKGCCALLEGTALRDAGLLD